jgi:hypothetical protein
VGKVIDRSYRLGPGLKEQLEGCLETKLEGHIKVWKTRVAQGLIGEEERSVFHAMRWLASRNDSRLHAEDGDLDLDDADARAIPYETMGTGK